jgi:hypothetical protein
LKKPPDSHVDTKAAQSHESEPPLPLLVNTDPGGPNDTTRQLLRGLRNADEPIEPATLGHLLHGVPVEKNVVIELAPSRRYIVPLIAVCVLVLAIILVILFGKPLPVEDASIPSAVPARPQTAAASSPLPTTNPLSSTNANPNANANPNPLPAANPNPLPAANPNPTPNPNPPLHSAYGGSHSRPTTRPSAATTTSAIVSVPATSVPATSVPATSVPATSVPASAVTRGTFIQEY